MELDVKLLEPYVQLFDENVTKDIFDAIQRNDWILTGYMVKNFNIRSTRFKNKIVSELFIAYYAQYLVDGKRRKPGQTLEQRLRSAKNRKISDRAFGSGLNIDQRRTNSFVVKIIRENRREFERYIAINLDKDVDKILKKEIDKLAQFKIIKTQP